MKNTKICSSKINSNKEFDTSSNDRIEVNYYKAYENRYSQVYKKDMLWSSKENTPEVLKCIKNYKISKMDKILDLGCGEGRDAIYLLDKGYNLMAVDYSHTVIEKCKELSNNKYNNCFKQFDLIKDELDYKFDFIYSIAVLHMFVLDEHRNRFLSFVREHLEKNGVCLICVLGDGECEYISNINEAFRKVKRTVMNNNNEIEIAATSCKIVNWENIEKEIKNNNLSIEEKWISKDIPEFENSMCIIVKKG